MYQGIKKFGAVEKWFREHEYGDCPGGWMEIALPIDSANWVELTSYLERTLELVEKKQSGIKKDEMDKFYVPQISAEYSKQELNAAAYLRLLTYCWWGREIGYFGFQTEDEQYSAALDRRQKNKHQYGCLFPTAAVAFADPLKSQLEQEGLRHLRFEPVIIAETRLLDERQRLGPDAGIEIVSAPAHKILKPLWKLTSDLVLPRFLYPLTQDGAPFSGDLTKGCGYDNGNSGLGLKYRRDEIAKLEPFDIAVTAERLGIHKDHCFRQIIVSQKFRQTMIKLGIKAAEYEPVILE